MSPVAAEAISTPRLLLVPLDADTADRIVRGDLSRLEHAPGWPHDDTLDGVRLCPAGAMVWLVTRDGVVIGDCGTVGPVEDDWAEIGFGLAAEERGRGYGTELVAALADWLLAQPTVERLVATTDVGNAASRRVLERAGFVIEREADGIVGYAR